MTLTGPWTGRFDHLPPYTLYEYPRYLFCSISIVRIEEVVIPRQESTFHLCGLKTHTLCIDVINDLWHGSVCDVLTARMDGAVTASSNQPPCATMAGTSDEGEVCFYCIGPLFFDMFPTFVAPHPELRGLCVRLLGFGSCTSPLGIDPQEAGASQSANL